MSASKFTPTAFTIRPILGKDGGPNRLRVELIDEHWDGIGTYRVEAEWDLREQDVRMLKGAAFAADAYHFGNPTVLKRDEGAT